jgi:hypothetical protein
MRTELEKKLAILTLQKERETVQPVSMFGDDNHKAIDLSIKVIEGNITEGDLYSMEEDGELSDTERMNVESFMFWLDGTGEELEEILLDPDNLVTELPTNKEVVGKKHCTKMCKECPFSNKSAEGWLADYTGQDIIDFMNAEVSFPCHLQMSDGELNIDQTKRAIDKGEMKLCRGYVELIVKSAKSPYKNEQLVEAIKDVKENGLSDNSMDIFEFFEHHNLEKS